MLSDLDGDGYGDMGTDGLYVVGTDCNDDPSSDINGDGTPDASSIFPGSVTEAVNNECMLDVDGDGYGDIGATGFYVVGTDCEDDQADIYPTAPEKM